MAALGPTELVTVVVLLFSSGGFMGLPVSLPPLPPDPVIQRVAPDECLLHLATAGVAAPAGDSRNLTERMLADQEMQEFLGRFADQVMALVRKGAGDDPEMAEAMSALAEVALTQPMALTVEKFQPPGPQGPPQVVASLVIRVGERGAALEKAAEWLAGSVPVSIEDVKVAGQVWQRFDSPLGPVSWGLRDGTFVLAVGPGALESLLARLADADRKPPAWMVDLRKRLPVARESTLSHIDAGRAIEILTSLPAPDRDRFVAVLEATGIAKLASVGAISGMTAEGYSSAIRLGFEGRPSGLFAAPATGIGTKVLSRVPADATLAQAWSLDLSATLATVVGIIRAADPAAAEAFTQQLERFRAVAGFDIDQQLLEPLGPDWTVMSLPAPGGMIPGVAIVAGVRDRATFAKTHKALLGILKNATAAGDLRLEVREVPYRGQTLFCLEASGEGMAIPVTPTWCLTDDTLVVTLSPQLMKTLLARKADARGIEQVPEVKAALASGEPALVGELDPISLLGSLCGLYEMAAPVARSVLRDQGLDIDLPQLPPTSAIMPYARPGVTVIRHEPDGIVLASTGTVPLGPLAGGGGILGVSPASTPVLIGLLLPAVQSARQAAQRVSMQNNFKQILFSILMYESANGRLPPQAICDADGKPLLSWRVAMLPYLERQDLYKQFRLDEPWDSEHNLKLVPLMPTVLADPAATPEQIRAGLTTIQVMTGPDTTFRDGGKGLRVGAISDGLSNTIGLVEAAPDNAVPWTKPDDVEFDPDRPLAGVGNPTRPGGLFTVGMLDGSVRMFPLDIDPEQFEALVTPSGGEVIRFDR